MNCGICCQPTNIIFSKRILNRYDGDYHKCVHCGFIQVSQSESWLSEAYSSAISKTDIGLLFRNFNNAKRIRNFLLENFDTDKTYLDYAGGYGIFTRLMRDHGFDFYHEDTYCENLFACDFDARGRDIGPIEMITAFEFMEHVSDPIAELQSIFQRTDSFLFSTEIIPKQNLENWWYLATETGQHISFYTVKSLEVMAEKFQRKLYTNEYNLHLITSRHFKDDILKPGKIGIFSRLLSKKPNKLKSRLNADYKTAKRRIT